VEAQEEPAAGGGWHVPQGVFATIAQNVLAHWDENAQDAPGARCPATGSQAWGTTPARKSEQLWFSSAWAHAVRPAAVSPVSVAVLSLMQPKYSWDSQVATSP
jgi:hypothetical protein